MRILLEGPIKGVFSCFKNSPRHKEQRPLASKQPQKVSDEGNSDAPGSANTHVLAG